MKLKLLFLIFILSAMSAYAQEKDLFYKNGLRIEAGRAFLGTGDLIGIHIGGMWSQRLTNRIDLELGGGYMNFPNSYRGGGNLEQMTNGAILESYVKYNLINHDRIKIYAGAGPFLELLQFNYRTGYGVRFVSSELRLEENSSGGYFDETLGINLTIGAKIRLFDQYYLNVSPVQQFSGHYNSSLRVGFEARF